MALIPLLFYVFILGVMCSHAFLIFVFPYILAIVLCASSALHSFAFFYADLQTSSAEGEKYTQCIEGHAI